MANEIIDFELERGRHGELLGREDVMAEIDALMDNAPRGWVLVKGSPGLGKSALLATWLRRQEEKGRRVPQHFLRRGVEDWAQPEVAKRNLMAQIDALFPDLVRPKPFPVTRLRNLLELVSAQVLVPSQERMVLVVDGLDEVEAEVDGSNPLQRFLPHVLPAGVWILCASRPKSPYLNWLERLEGVRTLELDEPRWTGSNARVVREYWEQARSAPRFTPPLTASFVEEVVRQAQGNVLYAVTLLKWLEGQPMENRRVEVLPQGLEKLLEASWERIQGLPPELRRRVEEGLGLLAVAREALPGSILTEAAGDLERFLKEARPFLLEESGPGDSEKTWRPFHESFRSFILESKLGSQREQALHLRLAQQLCRWPVSGPDEHFRTSYVLRHGVTHWLKAQQWEQARGLYMDLLYLEKRCQLAGVHSVERALKAVAMEAPEQERKTARELYRAVLITSHHLKWDPKGMASHVYNWLRCSGWTAERLEAELRPTECLPALRLRHPVRTEGLHRTFEGHASSVAGCALTPDGRRVVSASRDRTLKLWDLETGKELATLEGHGDAVSGCAVTPDRRHVVSASRDRTLKVWDLETGQERVTLKGHSAPVTGCAVTPDGQRVVSASEDGTLKTWELASGRELATLEGHGAPVMGCAVTPDGRRVVSASWDRTLKVWELETGQDLMTLAGHEALVAGCAVTPDGRHVVSASADDTLKVWDLETGKQRTTLEGHWAPVTGCVVTPDGQRVVSSSEDETLMVWELASGRELETLRGHDASVSSCEVTPDGQRVVSASEDGTLKVGELEYRRAVAALEGHKEEVNGCALMPDGRRLVSASKDRTLKVWDLETGKELASWEAHKFWVSGCAVTPDGRRLVSAGGDRVLKVWDLETGTELARLKGHKDWVSCCAVTPDGRHVVSASGDKTLKVWDLETGSPLATLEGHEALVTCCVVTPDGRRVVSAA
ncbi:MAG TPA: AAA family ATPase, partial [Myxococcaceae bacterium]